VIIAFSESRNGLSHDTSLIIYGPILFIGTITTSVFIYNTFKNRQKSRFWDCFVMQLSSMFLWLFVGLLIFLSPNSTISVGVFALIVSTGVFNLILSEIIRNESRGKNYLP
jgi:uncharacterized membrane-anchored protein